jgi:hypothetical protein
LQPGQGNGILFRFRFIARLFEAEGFEAAGAVDEPHARLTERSRTIAHAGMPYIQTFDSERILDEYRPL